ncbi:MAG TPA: VTT domain-containing protein [Pirellulales bacterium]|nr:VTT domain-containing protein [Pirellulales bacterium]
MFTWLIEQLKWLISLKDLENVRQLVNLGGPWWISYAILSAVIFSETGLLVGFFLPGDSLLFAAGFLSSQSVFSPDMSPGGNLLTLNACLATAAVLGDAVNYYVGLQMGQHVLERGRLRFVKHDHLVAAQEFYDRHGAMAIILARFVPVVRTFTPFVAGVARMSYRRFAIYNLIGGVGWVASMSVAGYWLGQIPIIAKNFELAVLAVVIVSVLPVVFGVARKWRQSLAARRRVPLVAEPAAELGDG